MTTYRYLGISAPVGSLVRFDTASGSDTPAVIRNPTGTVLDGSRVQVGSTGITPTVIGTDATVYVKRIRPRPFGEPDDVLEVLGSITGTDTTYVPPSPGGGNVSKAAVQAVVTVADLGGKTVAQSDAAYAFKLAKADAAKTATFTASTAKPNLVDISGGSFAANLPAAGSVLAGTEAFFKVAAGTDPLVPTTALTVTAAGTDTVNGGPGQTLTMRVQNRAKRLVSDGVSNWVVLGGDTDATVEDTRNDGRYKSFQGPKQFGAKLDGTVGYRGVATTGQAVFTDPDYTFTAADIGKKISHLLCGTGAVAYTSDVQTIAISGSPTGGSTLLMLAEIFVNIAWNATPAAVQTQLQAAWNSGITVAGTTGQSYVITFPKRQGAQPDIFVKHALTGGTSPNATLAHTTLGTGGRARAWFPTITGLVNGDVHSVTVSSAAPGSSQITSTGSTGSITAGQSKFTDPSADFPAWLDGSYITIPGAGAAGAALTAQVRAVSDDGKSLWLCNKGNANSVVNAATTVSNVGWTINQGRYAMGTDDTAALTAAAAACAATVWRRMHLDGTANVSSEVLFSGGITVTGDGMEACNPVVCWPTSGSVIRAFGDTWTAGTGVVRMGAGATYAEAHTSNTLRDITIDAGQVADWAVRQKGNLTHLDHVEGMAGLVGAFWLDGAQTTASECVAAQINIGTCLWVTESDAQWTGGFLRNGAIMCRVTGPSDFQMDKTHFFNGYGNSNSDLGINLLIDTDGSNGTGRCQFTNIMFDDVRGPHVVLKPILGTAISEVVFTGCLFFQAVNTIFFTFPDNVFPIVQVDLTAGNGTIDTIVVSGGIGSGGNSGMRFKSIIDYQYGSNSTGNVGTVAIGDTVINHCALHQTGNSPGNPIWNGVVARDTVAGVRRNSQMPQGTSSWTATGDGTTTTFSIAHNMGIAPKKFVVTAASAGAAAPFFVTASATNVTVTYTTAPASGAALTWQWMASL